MYRLAAICSVLTFLICTSSSFSQQKYPNTLLWRISGKGLAKPSYLYGTMHLTDKRLFNFGDSVYRAIEKCDGLAIELNPDEMGAYMVNQALEQMEGKKLSEILSRKDYNKYSASLSKKFKKPANDLTTGDIVKEKNKWVAELMEKGEMTTFVDAWLYSIARRQGKWVGGIEDMVDQSGLLEELIDNTDIDYLLASDSVLKKNNDKVVNKMVDLYVNHDLAGIDALFNTEYADEKDVLLTKRNIKMARRIDSLLAFRTMFVAIGVAHLPGDSGVIQLLQKRGFTVEPVFSSKKMNASEYKIKEVAIPWQAVEDEQKLYKASMPGNPASVKLYDLIEMKFLLDISNLSNYCTMAIVNPDNKSNKDSLLNKLAGRMMKPSAVQNAKTVFSNSFEGREFIQESKGENIRLQAFIHGKVVYVAFIYGVKKETIHSADADKFFASFIINQAPPVVTSTYRFTDSIMGIDFVSPARLVPNTKLSSVQKGWKISCYNGADNLHGTYIMLFSKEVTASHHLVSDSIVHKDLVDNLSAKCSSWHTEEKIIRGYKAVQFIGRNIDQPGLYVRAVSIIRDNRNIVFLNMSDSANLFSAELEKMYGSLRFLSPAVEWKTQTTPNEAARTWTPGAFRTFNEEALSYFVSYDTTTATSYIVMVDTLDKYTWHTSDSSYWAGAIPLTDSVISEKNIQNGPLKGKEFLLTRKSGGMNHQRIRMLLNDSIVYKLMLSGKKDRLFTTNADLFFSKFTVLHPAAGSGFITRSKAPVLLNDLSATDSATRMAAFHALIQATFEKKDIPLLHAALFKPYRSIYDDGDSNIVNNKIASILGELGDTASIEWVRSNYPALTGIYKHAGLLLLSKIHTRESYSTFASLLQQYGLTEPFDFQLRFALEDSLALTATIYPALQTLLRDTAQVLALCRLNLALFDSGFVSKEQLLQNENYLLKAAAAFLPESKRTETPDKVLSELAQLIGRFKTSASNAMLKNFLSAKPLYLKSTAVKALLANNQTVPAAVLNQLAANDEYRAILYDDLKELKRTALFPKQYATQSHFAASAIFNSAAAEDYEPQKLVFLSTKTAVYKGKKYLFYLYKVQFEGDEEPESYLGIAGGYVPGSTSLQPKEDLSGLYWEESYDAAKVNEFFKEYLKGL